MKQKHDWLEVTETTYGAEAGSYYFMVKFGPLASLKAETPQILVEAIMMGVEDYALANIAPSLLKEIMPKVQAEIEKHLIEKFVNELGPKVLAKLDIDSLAKIATIQAGKNLGNHV
jgi:hypothetical protein